LITCLTCCSLCVEYESDHTQLAFWQHLTLKPFNYFSNHRIFCYFHISSVLSEVPVITTSCYSISIPLVWSQVFVEVSCDPLGYSCTWKWYFVPITMRNLKPTKFDNNRLSHFGLRRASFLFRQSFVKSFQTFSNQCLTSGLLR